jgi:hypothetical protein
VKSEFIVDDVECVAGGILVRGAVNQGILRVGDVFMSAHALVFHPGPSPGNSIIERTELRGVRLSVESILAYQHSLSELPMGMTGELKLSGQGTDVVKNGDLLEL